MNQADRLPKTVICLLVLTAITFAVFAYTAHIRKPWFGVLSLKNHHVLTGDTLKFSRYWYNEGPWKLKFGMFRNPPSAEFPTLDSRTPYVSYPPGALVPVYLLSKAAGHEPTPEIVMGYNLANHFFLSLFLSWIAFFFCAFGGLPLLTSLLFSLVPIIISQLMPSPLYFFQNVYWADQAVLPLMVFFILLELLRDNVLNGKKARWVFYLQTGLACWGTMTDWFFVVFAAVVFLKRMAMGEYAGSIKIFFTNAVKFWAPVMAVIAVFLWQVSALHAVPLLIQRYQERTGLAAGAQIDPAFFIKTFWDGHVAQGFGPWAGWCLWGCLWFLLFMIMAAFFQRFSRKEMPWVCEKDISLAALLLLPCLLQIYLFKNHSAVHNFSALKLVVPLALVPCVVVPVMSGKFFRFIPGVKIHSAGAALVFIFLALTCTLNVHPGYRSFFHDNNPVFKQLGGFIARNTGYEDVVFSTKGGIDENPLYLAYSGKRVYPVQNIYQIYLFIQGLKGSYTINILTTTEPETDPGIRELMSMAFDVRREGGLALYKIKGQ